MVMMAWLLLDSMLSLWLPTLRCFMPVRMTCSMPKDRCPISKLVCYAILATHAA
jgi:hypothetical protein